MKRSQQIPSMLVSALLIGGSFTLAAVQTQTALAGDYDFSFTNLDHMRKAYHMCGMKHFQGGDCSKVYEKCWLPPHTIPHLFSASTSDCEDMWRMTNNGDDANKALQTGQTQVKGGNKAGMADGTHTDEAVKLDATSDATQPCTGAADQGQCQTVVAADASGDTNAVAGQANAAGETQVASSVRNADDASAIASATTYANSTKTDSSVTAPLSDGQGGVLDPVAAAAQPSTTTTGPNYNCQQSSIGPKRVCP